jgi:hypothetical protein
MHQGTEWAACQIEFYDALFGPGNERMTSTEGLSFGAIAERLNKKGYTTRTGSNWSAMQVKRVLDRSAAYAC